MKMRIRPQLALITSNLRTSGRIVLPVILISALLSGFRSGVYTTAHLASGAPPIVLTLLLAWLGGAVLGPALLDWLPGRRLPFKGVMAGILALTAWPAVCMPLHLTPLDVTMAILIIPAASALLTLSRAPTVPPTEHDAWRNTSPLLVAPIALAAGIWIMARFF